MIDLHTTTAEIENEQWRARLRLREQRAPVDETRYEVKQAALFPMEEDSVLTEIDLSYRSAMSDAISGAYLLIQGLWPPEETTLTWVDPALVDTRNILLAIARDYFESVAAYSVEPSATATASALAAAGYRLRRSSQVLEFLASESALIPTVTGASPRIREHFPDADLVLEFMPDPEVPASAQLLILIHTNLPVDEALDKLDLVDENWWFDTSHDARGRLCVDVEFA